MSDLIARIAPKRFANKSWVRPGLENKQTTTPRSHSKQWRNDDYGAEHDSDQSSYEESCAQELRSPKAASLQRTPSTPSTKASLLTRMGLSPQAVEEDGSEEQETEHVAKSLLERVHGVAPAPITAPDAQDCGPITPIQDEIKGDYGESENRIVNPVADQEFPDTHSRTRPVTTFNDSDKRVLLNNHDHKMSPPRAEDGSNSITGPSKLAGPSSREGSYKTHSLRNSPKATVNSPHNKSSISILPSLPKKPTQINQLEEGQIDMSGDSVVSAPRSSPEEGELPEPQVSADQVRGLILPLMLQNAAMRAMDTEQEISSQPPVLDTTILSSTDLHQFAQRRREVTVEMQSMDNFTGDIDHATAVAEVASARLNLAPLAPAPNSSKELSLGPSRSTGVHPQHDYSDPRLGKPSPSPRYTPSPDRPPSSPSSGARRSHPLHSPLRSNFDDDPRSRIRQTMSPASESRHSRSPLRGSPYHHHPPVDKRQHPDPRRQSIGNIFPQASRQPHRQPSYSAHSPTNAEAGPSRSNPDSRNPSRQPSESDFRRNRDRSPRRAPSDGYSSGRRVQKAPMYDNYRRSVSPRPRRPSYAQYANQRRSPSPYHPRRWSPDLGIENSEQILRARRISDDWRVQSAEWRRNIDDYSSSWPSPSSSGNNDNPRSTYQSPSLESSMGQNFKNQASSSSQQIGAPTLPCHNVPGLWFGVSGLNKMGILTATFEIDEETAVKWNLSNESSSTRDATTSGVSQKNLSLELCCFSKKEVEMCMQASPNTTPQRLASAIFSLEKGWPTQGQLIIIMHPDTAKTKSWLPDELGPSDPLISIEDFVQKGQNVVQFIQLCGMSENIFVLYATEDASGSHSNDATHAPLQCSSNPSLAIMPASVMVVPYKQSQS